MPLQRLILGPADIERQLHLSRNDIDRAGLTAERTGRRHQRRLRGLLNEQYPLGGSRQRIFAQQHRHRAGVSRLTAETAVKTTRAVDGGDHAQS